MQLDSAIWLRLLPQEKKRKRKSPELCLVWFHSSQGDVRSPRGTCALRLACAHLRTHKISLGSGVIGLHGSEPSGGRGGEVGCGGGGRQEKVLVDFSPVQTS